MNQLWLKFLDNRKLEKGATPKTIRSYGNAWAAWGRELPEDVADLNRDTIAAITKALYARGTLGKVSINSYLRVLRAFVIWLADEGKIPARIKVNQVKCEVPRMRVFGPEQIANILRVKAESKSEERVALLALVIVGTGVRASEALALEWRDVDFANRLMEIRLGKGQKHRMVPLSRTLFRVLQQEKEGKGPRDFIFGTESRSALGYRNALRDFALMCKRLGITGKRTSFHTLRATFATRYSSQGGDVFKLQQIMGHSTLTMTQRYVNHDQKELVKDIDSLVY